MRLKKLEIQGFKSFADRTEITFEHGITGIVGPNGCGKSNISDAVRWVLGEQSAKTLRGGKMEDVIFGGTEKRRRLSFCEVVLIFDNEDRALPLDFGEVGVSRRVYRSGESEYAINKTPCRLRDVVELFRDTGIGKEGYSLIGQGRIDEILSVKSEDRRQIFEEAAGIVKYKARRAEAQKRMENTRLNLTRVEDILGELEARVEPLRAQSETAREYLALREELKGLELNAFLVRTERYGARIEELTCAQQATSAALEEAEAEKLMLGQRRDDEQAALSGFEADAAEAREQVQRLIREVEAREGAASVLRERMAATERDRARIEGDLAAARSGGGGIEAQLSKLAAEIESGRARLAALKLTQAQAEQELRAREQTLALREEESERLKAAVIDTMNRLSDVKSEQARLDAMRDALMSRIESMAREEALGGDQGELLLRAVLKAEERLAEERAAKDELDQLSANAVERVKALAERGEELNERLAQLTGARQDVASRLKVLEEMQRDYEGYQFSVKNVLMQARRTGSSGVHGVVASLIQVPRRLERAIDVALGGALQHIVVEREEDAARLIEYLKAGRLGRATFLPLSAIRGRLLDGQERRLLTMPGCLGLASELIGCDERYRGVVDNLLGRTVIAEDLKSGIAIMRAGRHAFRLVTLEGDVMNPGGSMTGGSVQSRVTSLLSREREVGEHREQLQRLEVELLTTREEAQAQDEARAELKRERAELFERLHQQEIACAREEAHLAAAQGELSAHEGRAQRSLEAREQLEAQLQSVEDQLSSLKGRSEGESQANASQKDQAVELSRMVVQLRSDVAGLSGAVADGRVKLTACERDLNAQMADQARLSRQKSDTAQLLMDSEQALEAARLAFKRDQAQLKEDERGLAQFRAELNGRRARFQAIEEQRTGAQAALKQAGDGLDRVRARIDELTDRSHRGELQLSRVEGELKGLTDRVWEDYELSYEGASAFRDEGFKLGESEKRIAEIRARIKSMGSVNVAAVDEYRETVERFGELNTQRDDLIKAELDLNGIIEDLSRRMEAQFKAEFYKLNDNFQQTFVELFGGGQAELRLADPKDALGCGIDVVAQPPGKKLTMLSLLSGGERALTAIAILFAMLRLKPTPFCFLDEIEAALDDANIDNYAEFLKAYSRKTQFVIVTHRKGTMERCDALYGVAMEEKGVSRMVSVRLSEAQAM
ncbi:MAG: chromosome segregation protein SMC [Christensenellaceae bacterium]|nr:chromosome segregation protein SMC [Christensenellaceae bacterium]